MSYAHRILARFTPPVVLGGTLIVALAALMLVTASDEATPPRRSEVVFWHFWGGEDRRLVESIVRRFNEQQQQYHVRAIAMPGNNLDLKVFLAVTGGDPPDLINQDDPIIADWAQRGALLPIDKLVIDGASRSNGMDQLQDWMLPTAYEFGRFDGRLYAVCNGLDARALYYDRTLLEEAGIEPPKTLEELDRANDALIVRDSTGRYQRFGYLPDARRLWAWGPVFGGSFYDADRREVTADHPGNIAALQWMARYRERYGSRTMESFRQGDQSLPGSIFPLLPAGVDSIHGRYAFLLDGQWRVREIRRFVEDRQARGLPYADYGVLPLPPPEGGQTRAGWLNGNFFLVPRGANNSAGAWEFIKFWIGFSEDPTRQDEAASRAADHYIRGGWIPVSPHVIEQPIFQEYLDQEPLFRVLVDLAGSPHQKPIPAIPGAALYDREIRAAGAEALYRDDAESAAAILERVDKRMQDHLDRVQHSAPESPREDGR